VNFTIYLVAYTQAYRGWTKKMKTAVKDTHFFVNMELGHHLPVTQLVSFQE
jgi:hypothetical protein